MRLLTVLALVFSATAFAGEYASKRISFSPSTYSGGTTHYYNCDSLEDQAESHLKDLGAINVRIQCHGGLESGTPFPTPAHLSGSFDVPVPTPEDDGVSAVVLKGRESCSFNTEFLDYVLPLFTGAKVASRKASCWGGRGDRWSYEIHFNH